MKKIMITILGVLIIGCSETSSVDTEAVEGQTSEPIPVEPIPAEPISEKQRKPISELSLAGKSGDALLQACQDALEEMLDRPESFELIADSAGFENMADSGRYKLTYNFNADTTDLDDNVVGTSKFEGMCEFDEGGNIVSSMSKTI